jgi:uncharacterized protein YuzE
MKLSVDREADALSLRFNGDRPIVESEEIAAGIILDFDPDGCVVGVEILNLSHRTTPDQLKTLHFTAG